VDIYIQQKNKLNMEFNLNNLSLSHNGQYILYENLVYDIGKDATINLKNTDISFWLDFLKENSKESYKNKISNLIDLQKNIRETVYSLSEIFDRKTKDFFILEFEQKFSSNLLIENPDTELNVKNISSSWDYIIESISSYITINEQSEDKGFFSKLKDKVNAGTDWLMDKGLGWFFENLRKALFSWGGAAVQAFLATSTAGVGNVILVVVWGAMLAWDILLGIKGDWNWVNLIIDLIGVVTTGPGAKIVSGIFKQLGILGTKLPLSGIIKKMSTSGSSVVKWFSSILSKIVSGLSQIGSYMLQGVSWLGKKLGIKSLEKVSSQLSSKLTNIGTNIAKSSASLKQTAVKSATSVKNKLVPAGKTLGKALASKPGQIATAAGLTYGINSAFGADNRAFAGAYGNDDIDMGSQLASQNVKYDVSQLP
jgi:hypothetical protein